MDFIPFRPDVMKMRIARLYDNNFLKKSRKMQENKIRPANCKIDGVIMPSVRGLLRTLISARGRKLDFLISAIPVKIAVKTPDPRKGTETPFC